MYSRRQFLFMAVAFASAKAAAQGREPGTQFVSVVASRYEYNPRRIDIGQDDVVRIELRTLDIAHSMTIDAYRISKRVNPGTPVTFEFRADKAGTFPFYCNLQIDEGCRQMRGELVVRPRH
jgi:heme/copper-type cytochrome/quinol oxidase subunit 2